MGLEFRADIIAGDVNGRVIRFCVIPEAVRVDEITCRASLDGKERGPVPETTRVTLSCEVNTWEASSKGV